MARNSASEAATMAVDWSQKKTPILWEKEIYKLDWSLVKSVITDRCSFTFNLTRKITLKSNYSTPGPPGSAVE